MPKKKEVLEVWTRNWTGCVALIKKRLKYDGTINEPIELWATEGDIGKHHESLYGKPNPDCAFDVKHLRITIEEL